jgi:geranylgeranyl reductase family protein
MGIDPTAPGFARIDGVRTYGAAGKPVEFRWDPRSPFPRLGLVRRRADFDQLLVERAGEAGASFREAVRVTEPALRGPRVVGARFEAEDGSPGEIRARFVVAADGAPSRFASLAGAHRGAEHTLAVAARGYVRSPRPQEPLFEAFLTLRAERRYLPGYGWIFPMGGGELNVGAFLIVRPRPRRAPTARNALAAFVSDLPPHWGLDSRDLTQSVRSAPIPMGIERIPRGIPGLIVVGDAAGLVNPFTGEGIGYAMESGRWAAEAIAEAIGTRDTRIVDQFPALIRERYGRSFAAGQRFVRAIIDPTVMRAGTTFAMRGRFLARPALRAMADLGHSGAVTSGDRILRGALWWATRVRSNRR